MTAHSRVRGNADAIAPVVATALPRRGVGLDEFRWSPDGFWGERQSTNRDATFAHCVAWMDRVGWLENFDRVARGEVTEAHAGWEFSDSEIYKLLEGMAWEMAREPSDALAATYADLVARVAAAQDADGYLCTAFGHPGLPERYSDLEMGHELYNVGHLLQAAVARVRSHGEDPLVHVARRAADHVCREFGADARQGLCGHPEIEVGLAEFGRAVGEPRYIEQARLFIERRGHGTLAVRPLLSADYFQDDIPVSQADVLRGHAVRALYLSAGAADVAVETGDDELLETLRRQWSRTVERRTYLTGGMGSRHQDEGFGADWELPPDRAYCETCAGVASTMFAWRLYLATGQAQYADLIERTLFNVIATSPSAEGTSFFYSNPLQVREEAPAAVANEVNMRAEGGVRAPWFDVSCCPTNVSRTMASLAAYAASIEGDTVALLQYGASTVVAPLASGVLKLRVQTAYPSDGAIRVVVDEAPDAEVTVRLRVPAWSRASGTAPGGEPESLARGWWDVTRVWSPGDAVLLELDTAPRVTWPDPRIDAQRGTVAIERGPLVLCAESHDLPEGVELDDVVVALDGSLAADADGATVSAVARPVSGASGAVAYAREPYEPLAETPLTLPLVPYFRWAERGPSAMRVFLRAEGSR